MSDKKILPEMKIFKTRTIGLYIYTIIYAIEIILISHHLHHNIHNCCRKHNPLPAVNNNNSTKYIHFSLFLRVDITQ